MPVLDIKALGAGGDGVAHLDNQPWYIPFSAIGDKLEAEEAEKRGKGVAATLKTLIEPSKDRQNPTCRHFGTCGGCNLQHIAPAPLADWKQDRVHQILTTAGLSTMDILSPIISPAQSRRRVEFVASKRKKGVMIGYHIRRSHQVFDVGDCPLITPGLFSLVKPLRQMLADIMPRNSKARLMITETTNGPDLLITANLTDDLSLRETLAAFCQEQSLSRISVYQEEEKRLDIMAEISPPLISIGQDEVALPPGGFLQATHQGQEALINLLEKALPKRQAIADLFCGCGSFSLPAARLSKSVHAIEGDENLIRSLQKAANVKMLPITTECRDLFRRPLLAEELNRFETVIIDPPRAGAQSQTEELAKSTVQKVISISCNPVTFARDAAELVRAGFKLGPVTPVDQFLWSPHVELFCVLEREA